MDAEKELAVRVSFEHWAGGRWQLTERQFARSPDGAYVQISLQCAWEAWQAAWATMGVGVDKAAPGTSSKSVFHTPMSIEERRDALRAIGPQTYHQLMHNVPPNYTPPEGATARPNSDMTPEGWMVEPHTDEALARLRAVAQARHKIYKGQRVPVYTCATCGNAQRCAYAFDMYNTDGDCLMEK